MRIEAAEHGHTQQKYADRRERKPGGRIQRARALQGESLLQVDCSRQRANVTLTMTKTIAYLRASTDKQAVLPANYRFTAAEGFHFITEMYQFSGSGTLT